MSRTAGTSILVFGIVLGVVGAIMYWAVTAKADGFDINAAGLILFWVGFWVGVVTALVGLVLTFMGSRSTTVRRSDALDGGRYEYEEEHRSL
jgi:heme/copper-type cytochrome/quinol oxidase subunit 1